MIVAKITAGFLFTAMKLFLPRVEYHNIICPREAWNKIFI